MIPQHLTMTPSLMALRIAYPNSFALPCTAQYDKEISMFLCFMMTAHQCCIFFLMQLLPVRPSTPEP